MTRARIAGWALAIVLVFLALAAGLHALERIVDPGSAVSSAIILPASETHPSAETRQGFLYGRVTAVDGSTYEGRLRWGGGEEAFWGDYFNGSKSENRWAAQAPPEQLRVRRPVEIFGIEVARREREIDLDRPFMARFGDVARIEARGGDVRLTLKSGTMIDLDRSSAGDFDDGVSVWVRDRGVVDLGSRRIRTIELLPTPSLGAAPYRLHGTVRTRQGAFTGFLQWNREEGVGTDRLDGHSAQGELGLRFDSIRSIVRDSSDGVVVTLLDGREIALSGTREVGPDSRGIYVDDRRYGRVLVSWEAFERVDLSTGGSGPAYDDFPPGRPLTGSVTTRAGARLSGRLVYDLDESETTETLDAPSQGVSYTIPFGLIASVVPSGGEERGARLARVILHEGEELRLERSGDLGEGNAGMLIFVEGRRRPEHVRWTDIERVDFDRPQAMYPPFEEGAGESGRDRERIVPHRP